MALFYLFKSSALSSDWHPNNMNSLYWSMSFQNFWRTDLCHDVAPFTDHAQRTLVCCTVNKTWNKQSACIKLIIHSSDNLPIYCGLEGPEMNNTKRYKVYSRIYLWKFRRCPWYNGYRCKKWTRQHEFKSWTRLIAFHIALIPWERYESNYSPSSYG